MEKLTIQALLSQHLAGIYSRHSFPLYQKKALQRLSVCRTHALGGHAQYCEAGHLNGVWYNSCKHRSCPQCGGIGKEQWLGNMQDMLLNCPHHHVIFTLPESLNTLWRFNRDAMTDILFQAVRETLKEFYSDPRYLGATPGLLMVLHTWGRSLSLHPHIHCLISHGGIDAHQQWRTPKKSSLFPQKPVMMVFRGKFRALLLKAFDRQEITLPPSLLAHQFKTLLNKLGRMPWVVHFCPRYDHASGVAKYLARYMKGGPFNNSQLGMENDGSVRFHYRSHQTQRREVLRLSVDDFIKRILQHVPLPGKPSVRYGGLYAGPLRERLNVVRAVLGQRAVSSREILCWQKYLSDLGRLPKCHVCGLPLYSGEEVNATELH